MNVNDNNTSYRRGVLLGLTMAEVIILIVFLLLLAFSVLLNQAEKERIAERSLAENGYMERIIKVFSAQPADMEEDIVFAIDQLPEALSLIKERELARDETERPGQIIIRGLEKLSAQKEAEKNFDNLPPEQQLAVALEKQKELEADVKNLTDQKKGLITQIESKGRGVDWPPCWPDSNGKGTEYIYTIDLTDVGIVVADTTPTHRQSERTRLPTERMVYNVPVSAAKFQSMTAPLLHWSQTKECRFYVLVYDKTGSSQKALFKKFLITVEGSFYKRLVNTGSSARDEAQPELNQVVPKEESEEDSFFGGFFGGKRQREPREDNFN